MTIKWAPRLLNIVLWWRELLSYIIAVSAFVTMVLMLALWDDKPDPRWPITLNTLITIFSAILRSALLMPVAEALGELKWLWMMAPRPLTDIEHFDLASRGPRGSLQALFRWSWLQTRTLGALIILLAIFIDPLSQNALQNYTCLREQDGVAEISRTNNYTQWWSSDAGLASSDPRQGSMQAAIYAGLLDPPKNATQAISFNCQTGNCRFGEFSSLAVCSSVVDISKTMECTSNPELVCSLASGLQVGNRSSLITASPQFFTTAASNTLMEGRDQWPFIELYIMTFNVNSTCTEDPSSDLYCAPIPSAFQAEIYPCIHTYDNANISGFQLAEEVLSTVAMPVVYKLVSDSSMNDAYYSLASDHWTSPSLDCTPARIPEGLKQQSTQALHDGRHFALSLWVGQEAVNETHDYRDNSSDVLWYDPQCTFAINPPSTLLMWETLRTLFGALGVDQSSGFGYKSVQNDFPATRDAQGHYAMLWGDPWLLRLYAGGNATLESVTAYMAGLAHSMTAVIRRNGDPVNSSPETGTLYSTTQCIKVIWPWLIIDMLLLLLAIPFMVITIRRSHRITNAGPGEGGRGPWKTSAYPLLWCSLEDDCKTQHGPLDDVEDMRDSSDILEAMLVRTRDEPAVTFPATQNMPEGNTRGITFPAVHDQTGRGLGRWVLSAQRHHRPIRENFIRRWGARLANHLPL